MCVLQDHVYNSVFQFQLKKNQSSAKLSVGEVQGAPSPGATKYMKRFLSPTSTDRQPLHPGKEVSTNILFCVSTRVPPF